MARNKMQEATLCPEVPVRQEDKKFEKRNHKANNLLKGSEHHANAESPQDYPYPVRKLSRLHGNVPLPNDGTSGEEGQLGTLPKKEAKPISDVRALGTRCWPCKDKETLALTSCLKKRADFFLK